MQIEPLLQRVDFIQLLIGLILSGVLALISVRFKALSRSGGIGMIIVGTIVFGFGGIAFAVPVVFFFISSSLVSLAKSPSKNVAMLIFDKTGPRDIRQVLANGGIAAVCVVIYFITANPVWFFPYVASLSAAAADTWATELGTLSRRRPVSIVTLKSVEPGLSGGVTLLGLIAAAAGSSAVTLSGLVAILISGGITGYAAKFWLMCINAGLAGSILDSILGGSIQGLYRCPLCDRITGRKKHCGDYSVLVRGSRFINNDMVNLLSVLFAAGATALIFLI
jgi:uncharacterized protein (TIGR00297 family)